MIFTQNFFSYYSCTIQCVTNFSVHNCSVLKAYKRLHSESAPLQKFYKET